MCFRNGMEYGRRQRCKRFTKRSEKELSWSSFFQYLELNDDWNVSLFAMLYNNNSHKCSIWDFYSTESRSMAHFNHDSSAFSTSIEVLLELFVKTTLLLAIQFQCFVCFHKRIENCFVWHLKLIKCSMKLSKKEKKNGVHYHKNLHQNTLTIASRMFVQTSPIGISKAIWVRICRA